ncbi:GRIP and coiled-coil domain-containing protein 1 isoform X3 [Thunnus albacares]|uniref:GRIP and coiled-coil domain-containing protein 1 isoform X1 n=1 Tax=Thunnus albacares TaxID=8236 RepID=UPI001CF6F007|nr:GRIP and coiled-coil domain-containing protein 1 isoform X1 [Thunnus albacares]XP_044199205.1 GRIP and coiled-coil domain-containing protein 1 isoform X2 [Thunnus albacares]XP_044199206.1 GRIP and coiled-coil domain-containing protein 1 isoform X3 [Thunnus albacares]
MEKFGMSFGVGGASRKELLETIEAQKKQLVQYQTRFRDVVQAYRSLLKEKEALESSLQVLTGSQEVDQQDQDPLEDRNSPHSEASVDPQETTRDQSREDQGGPGGPSRSETSGSESGGPEQEQAPPLPSSEADRRVAQLKSQLSTLSGAVATVTQEKSRMEASFQADRRQLKQEVEELQDRLVAVTTQQEAELRSLQQQLAESRARIITQQHEREQEQRDHVLQLQELTCILQQQRLLKTPQDVDQGAESQVYLDQSRKRPEAAEEDQTRPDPRVDQLQQELQDLKNQVQDQVHSETRKACQAEERARERAQAAELRVAGLEQRLSELSELLGSCEKAKQRDQQVAQRLRERILQLDTENKMLAIAASNRSNSDLGLDESQLDVVALKDKMEKVKKLLLLAAQRDPDQAPIIQNLTESEAEPGRDSASALACQQELRQLKDEFERYKLRAQVVLKNKNAKDGCQARELEEVRDQLAELKEKYINLRIQSDKAEAQHCRQLEERQQQAAALQQSHRQEVERVEALHRDELLRLEAELHKQRERTMALLDEKDQELERLRAAALSMNTTRCAATDNTATDSADAEESEGDVISQALRRAAPTEPTLLLYAEQLARKEVEAGALRRQKHQLEEDVHQLQAKVIANAERHDEEAADLRGRLDKLIRDQSREGANMEYLKNIIYKFLTLQDASGRQQTLAAILTILHFSPQEKHAIMRLQGTTWWSSSKR